MAPTKQLSILKVTSIWSAEDCFNHIYIHVCTTTKSLPCTVILNQSLCNNVAFKLADVDWKCTVHVLLQLIQRFSSTL